MPARTSRSKHHAEGMLAVVVTLPAPIGPQARPTRDHENLADIDVGLNCLAIQSELLGTRASETSILRRRIS